MEVGELAAPERAGPLRRRPDRQLRRLRRRSGRPGREFPEAPLGQRLVASAIDWVVQGATYGSYAAATAAPPAGNAVVCGAGIPGLGDFGGALSISAVSDIDADGTLATVGSWQPVRVAATGAIGTPAPGLVGPGNIVVCGVATQPVTIGDGQVTVCSSDNVF
jgi:hypothetical protein